MKKLLCLLLFTFTFATLALTTYGQVTNAVFKPKGKVSSNMENVNKEQDPTFTTFKPAQVGNTKNNSNNKKLSQLEQGMNIVEDIVDKLIEREYSFSLLSGQKYMVNNCLGIKASAGQFDLKFANPQIAITNGKFNIKLEVDKIKFSALKVRSRPRVPDFSDPDPCHFSGKFEIGGEATDVSVRFIVDLVAIGMAGSGTGSFCSLAFGVPAEINWRIGGFNLRPMPNAIDNVAKEMVEDALNHGMMDIVYNRLMAAAKAVLPEYFQACESIADPIRNNSNVSNPATAGSENEKSATKPVSGLAKNMGRLNLAFPKDVEWDVDIYSGTKFIINRSSVNKHTSFPIAAGNYNLKLNTVKVENIIIEPGKETRLKAGILNITLAGPWELRTEEDKFLTSGNKPKKMALPVGRYLLKEGKNSRVVEITDQQEQLIAEEADTEEKWKITPGVASSIMGALQFNFPEDADWDMAIFQLPEREYVRTVSRGEKREDLDLGTGKFELVLNNVPVKDVPIEAGNRTALKTGVLQVNKNSSYGIWDATGKNHFKTENSGSRLVLPIGKYIIKIGGANVKIEVKDGETVEL